MGTSFKLTLEIEGDEDLEYKQRGFEFYKVNTYRPSWAGHYHTMYSYGMYGNTVIDLGGREHVSSTISIASSEASPVPEPIPTNTEEFIQARRAGRTVSNFIRNLMPEPLTRGRR